MRSFRRRASGNFPVFRYHCFVDHLLRFVIAWQHNFPRSVILPLVSGHRNQIAARVPDHFQTMYYPTIIQSDVYVSPDQVVIRELDLNSCNLHGRGTDV
jgi:hypothetical protein